MPLSGSAQDAVQSMVDAASPDHRRALCMEAEATLSEINLLMGQRILTADESKAVETSIEILVRVEATEKKKGWWFRTKRRVQLTQMYLGS